MIDSQKCAVVVPVYKKFEDLNRNEKLSTLNTSTLYSPVFIGPKQVVGSYLKLGEAVSLNLERMTYRDYNNLCKSPDFYEIFLDKGYTYMLLVQQDVWILEDRLDYFLDIFDRDNLDYIGAAWWGVHFCQDGTVGNGGYCIRRLSKFRDVSKKYPNSGGNEDVFFLMQHGSEFNIAPTRLALEFSWEEKPYYTYKITGGKLPSGVHAYFGTPDRITFWRQFIPVYETKCKAGKMDVYNPEVPYKL